MKVKISAICLCLTWVSCISQNTFAKHFDFYGADERAFNMEIVGDEVYIFGPGSCDEGLCFHLYKLNINGDTLWTKRYPNISPSIYGTVNDSILYTSGRFRTDSLEAKDGFRLFSFDLEGNLLESVKHNLSNLRNPPNYPIYSYIPIGVIANDEKVVVYGDTKENDNEGNSIRRGLVMYLNNDLSFDTLTIIEPEYDHIEMWNADLDNEQNFIFLFDYNVWQNNEEVDYRTFIKYDNFAKEVFRWNPPELYNDNLLLISFLVLRNNDIIIEFENESNNPNRSNDLIYVQENGEIKWRRKVDFAGIDKGIIDLVETFTGDILACGSTGFQEFSGSLIIKLHRQTGEVIWEKTYLDWNDEIFDNTSSSLWNIVELSDGSILASGERPNNIRIDSSNWTSNRDLYFLRLDSEGCLEPNCGGLEQHLAGEPKYIFAPSPSSFWYYQNPQADGGFYKKIFYWAALDDSIYYTLQTDEHLHPVEDDWFEEQGVHFFKLEDEGRRISYIQEEDTLLLYDFTLEVGDIFESAYIAQPLEVMESDTFRLTDGQKMRYWTLACSENPENTITWYEKMGTYYGFIWPSDFCNGDYGQERMTCFYRHKRLAHINPEFDDCFKSVSSEDIYSPKSNNVSIRPNPTSGMVSISVSAEHTILEMRLIDVDGNTRNLPFNSTSETIVDLAYLPRGIYFISILTNKGQFVDKLIIQD